MTTILLADDDGDLRQVYAECLRRAGFAVCEAADGAEALAVARARRPELLLLDVWMPHLNGFEVLDALRHDPTSGHMRVVVLSCQADADSRLEAIAAGAADYLVKGIGLADLVRRVRAALADCGLVAGPSA